MDFVTICEVFEGSIFPEELRGDSHVWTKNVEAFKTSIDGGDPEAIASLSLLRAINATLTYKHEKAQEILGILRQDAERGVLGPRWAFRSSSFAIYNLLCALHPFHTSGLSPLPLFCEQSRYDIKEIAPSLISSELRYVSRLQQTATTEDRIVFEAMCLLFCVRTSLRGSSYPTYSPEALSWDFEDRILGLNIRVDEIALSLSSMAIAEAAKERGMHAIVRIMERLSLEANYGMRQPLFAGCALAYHDALLEDGDEIGLACSKMILADNVVAGPESQPLLLNFRPLEKDHGDCLDIAGHTASEPLIKEILVSDLRTLSTHKEYAEVLSSIFDVSFIRKPYLLGPSDESDSLRVRSRAAFRLLLDAELLFSKAGSRRGLSAIALRKVSIVLRLAMQPDCLLSGPEPYVASLDQLKESARENVNFSGDINHEKLLLVFHCLSAPFRLDLKLEILHKLATWGWDWGQDTFSWDFVVALGHLAYHCGHWYRYKCGIITRARRAYELAQVIFSNQHTFAAQQFEVTLSLFDLYISLGLRRDARLELATLQKDLTILLTQQSETEGEESRNDRYFFSSQILRSIIKLASHDRITVKEAQSMTKYLELAELCVVSEGERERLEWLRKTAEIVTAKRLWIEHLEHGDIDAMHSFARKHLIMDLHPLITEEGDMWSGADFVMESMFIGRDVDGLDSVKDCLGQWIEMAIGVVESWMPSSTSVADLNGSRPPIDQGFARLSLKQRSAAIHAMTYCFRLSVLAKLWSLAKRLGSMTETWTPGYLSSVTCYIEDWPWRRYLWRGLLDEHHGRLEEALYSYSQSLHLFYTTIEGLDNERTRSMFNYTDVSRISSSIARLCLYLQEGNFQLLRGSEVPHMPFNNPHINVERLANRNPACLRPGLPPVPRAIEILECVKARGPYEQQALHATAIENQS